MKRSMRVWEYGSVTQYTTVPAALPPYRPTALPPYRPTALPHYRLARSLPV